MSQSDRAVGCCFCGSVQYAVTLPVKFCVHCHCPSCRRSGGAAFVTWFGVPIRSLRMGGQEHLKWFQSAPDVRRGFCSNCGTPLFYVSTKFPGDVHVTRSSVLGKPAIEPSCHIHYGQRVDWVTVGDALPRLGGETGTQPLLEPDGAQPGDAAKERRMPLTAARRAPSGPGRRAPGPPRR